MICYNYFLYCKSFKLRSMNKWLFLKAVKIAPFIAGLFLLLFNAVFWSNCTSPINNITGTSVTTSVVLYTASTQLKFCALHRHFIVYDSFASLWIDIKKIIDPIIGIKINFFIVLIGVVLVIWLIVFLVKKRKKEAH